MTIEDIENTVNEESSDENKERVKDKEDSSAKKETMSNGLSSKLDDDATRNFWHGPRGGNPGVSG